MTDSNLPANRPTRAIVADAEPIFDTAQFDHMSRIANVMGCSSLLPAHLRVMRDENGKEITGYDRDKVACWLDEKATISNAFLIVNQARLFGGIDPFALAQSSYFVHGRLGYEGKLVQALIERRVGAMTFEYNDADKTSGAYGIRVTGWIPNSNPARQASIEGTVADWQTKKRDGNVNDQWKGAAGATRMLHYRGTREWARMYAPGLVLGLLDDDDLEAIKEDYRAKQARPVGPAIAGRGFNPLADEDEPGERKWADKVDAIMQIVPEPKHDAETGEISPPEPQGGGEQPAALEVAQAAPEPASEAGSATETKPATKRLPRGFPQRVEIAIMEILKAKDLTELQALWDTHADPLVVEIETNGLPTPSIDRMREAFAKRKANFETVAKANPEATPAATAAKVAAETAPAPAAEPAEDHSVFVDHVRDELTAATTYEAIDELLASTVQTRDLPDNIADEIDGLVLRRRQEIGDALAAEDPSLRPAPAAAAAEPDEGRFPGDDAIESPKPSDRSDDDFADEVEGWISAMRRLKTVADLKAFNVETITPALTGPDRDRYAKDLIADAKATYTARSELLAAKEGGR